jgi:predicted Zn finger-like uncharacterized protein
MFTVCPKCALTLTVTAADLRVAQGFVRCGQCTNVFNALIALSDERQPQTATPQEVDSETPAAAREEEEEVVNEDGVSATAEQLIHSSDEAVPVDESSPLVVDDSIEQTSLEFNPAAADVSQIFIEPPIRDDEITGTYESIVLGARESVPAGLEETEEAVERGADEELNEQLESLAARIEAARQNELAQTHTGIRPIFIEAPPPPAPAEPSAPRHRRPLLRSAAVGALVLLLIAQVLNHYRDDLVVNPRLHQPLTALYGFLGVPLTPHWDVSAYEVHQLGASAPTQGAGELTVRASVKNDAAQPQPLPLLRVTLLDRFGNRLAAREVPPSAYLRVAPAAGTLLPAGERVDAQMAFVDPGRDAVGFEIDACLQNGAAHVTCASDAAR